MDNFVESTDTVSLLRSVSAIQQQEQLSLPCLCVSVAGVRSYLDPPDTGLEPELLHGSLGDN